MSEEAARPRCTVIGPSTAARIGSNLRQIAALPPCPHAPPYRVRTSPQGRQIGALAALIPSPRALSSLLTELPRSNGFPREFRLKRPSAEVSWGSTSVSSQDGP
jgi:hypothetical protein